MLREDIQSALTQAMKNKDTETTAALRLIVAKIKEKDVEIRGKGGKEAVDADIVSIMQSMIKQRRDSIKMYLDGNRPELAAKEEGEIKVIEQYMPQQMNDIEVEAAIKAIISEINAEGMKDMGKIMSALKEKHAGQLDFGKASGMIKNLLG